MRRRLLCPAAALVFTLAASPAFAWGFEAHQFIMGRAIDLLPAELKPFFTRYRDEVVIRVKDPDLWRSVGWPEGPNHFLDFGVKEYGPYPFKELPRAYDEALGKFGRATLERNGLLPWREEEMFGNLRRSFEGMGRGGTYSISDIVLFTGVASHYIQDAYQPLHASDNFDGGQTGQQGIHERFERDLFDRYRARLALSPPTPKAITAPRDAVFEILLASFQLVDPLLAADKKAVAGRTVYDDAYFDAFFSNARSILERQIGGAISATASMIIGAWEQAGKPPLRMEIPSPVQRVRQPR
jgi:hypothetical protein